MVYHFINGFDNFEATFLVNNILREGFRKKNMDKSIFGSDPPIHPPNMDETKNFKNFFSLSHPLDPSFAATHHCHQPLVYPKAATHHGGWLQRWMLVVGGISGGLLWWVVAVGVRG